MTTGNLVNALNHGSEMSGCISGLFGIQINNEMYRKWNSTLKLGARKEDYRHFYDQIWCHTSMRKVQMIACMKNRIHTCTAYLLIAKFINDLLNGVLGMIVLEQKMVNSVK